MEGLGRFPLALTISQDLNHFQPIWKENVFFWFFLKIYKSLIFNILFYARFKPLSINGKKDGNVKSVRVLFAHSHKLFNLRSIKANKG